MKVAIVGRGFGSYAMKPAFEARGWQADLVPSRDADAVSAACAGDYDLIAVHSPPFQHREHVLKAVEAGKAVLCDKPFGKDAADAKAMRDAAKAAGVLHFLNFEFRFADARCKVQELIEAVAIGQLVHCHYLSFGSYLRERGYGWLNDASLGGGWLGALGSHIIDAVRWHSGSEVADCGGISRVEIARRAGDDGAMHDCTAEDSFSVWLRTNGGTTVTIDAASASTADLPQRMQFLGTDGAIELVDENVVTLLKKGADPQVFDFSPGPDTPAWPSVYNWIGAVEEALKTGKQITPNFDDGVATAEVMDALKARMVRQPAS
ncbi:MAG: Gfo/Idh/MocA family oxidoreductase [Novosphingobium sp.]|nr:Gfo/Idh/MocA family oxidoreductase [Novosphingobium sp.]